MLSTTVRGACMVVLVVASIRGRYEYDDDSLTPGKKREGGLHQNLFDKDGALKGSARFIPDDDEPTSYSEPVVIYVDGEPAEPPGNALSELVAQLMLLAALRLIEVGTPHAKRLWLEKALPAIRSKKDRMAIRRPVRRDRRPQAEPDVVDATVVERAAQALVAAPEGSGTQLTSSEAQARYLLALAARRFSDDQLQTLAETDIGAESDVLSLQSALAQLPAQHVADMLRRLDSDAVLLAGDTEVENALGIEVVKRPRGRSASDFRVPQVQERTGSRPGTA